MQNIRYVASATGAKFHADNSFVRGIMGPVGSGKSVMCVMEILRRALEQPADKDGNRRSRWAVARNTYPELRMTTIKTWQRWIPDSVCPVVFGAPITGRMESRLPDGTKLDLEVFFIALDKVKDQKKLLSLDLTGVWLNEVREIPKTILDAATERVGRYPEREFLGWHGVIMDTNPPDDLSWYYHAAEVETPGGWRFFRQPPGLIERDGRFVTNPGAENIENLPPDYYIKAAQGAKRDRIRVMLMAEYGTSFDGKPVYDGSWNESAFVAPGPVDYLPGIPLLLGWDFGRTPACVVGQGAPDGQLRILAEFFSDNSGIRAFAENVVRPELAIRFPGYRTVSFGDPAGAAKGQANESSCLAELEAVGIPTLPAPSNDPTVRQEAVIKAMGRMIGGRPGLLVDPGCKRLIRGFNGGYHYEMVGKIMGGGEVRYNQSPCKNSYSHVHDAMQYLALGFSPEGNAARKVTADRVRREVDRNRRNYDNYNPLEL